MCYSAESSLRTTIISAFAIGYLLSSGIPHYQWLGVTLIGWCGMQFAEYILWSTNPRKHCTNVNQLITLTLIPLVLVLQPLGSLWGSLFVIPWNKSTAFRKQFILLSSVVVLGVICYFQYYDIKKSCTIVTPNGHLHWHTSHFEKIQIYDPVNIFIYFAWAFAISLPIFLYWKKSWILMSALLIMPIFGFIYGLFTDSKASLWCYYTSYTSVIASSALALKQFGIIDALEL